MSRGGAGHPPPPTDASHMPFFDAEARRIVYDDWWGQRKLDRDGNPAAFPLGWGLGYTTIEQELIRHTPATASVRVKNTRKRRGSTLAQVGFRRIELDAAAETTVTNGLDPTPMTERDPTTPVWSRRPAARRNAGFQVPTRTSFQAPSRMVLDTCTNSRFNLLDCQFN